MCADEGRVLTEGRAPTWRSMKSMGINADPHLPPPAAPASGVGPGRRRSAVGLLEGDIETHGFEAERSITLPTIRAATLPDRTMRSSATVEPPLDHELELKVRVEPDELALGAR